MENEESGFTLIELLLVLSIVTILSAIILPLGDRWLRETSEEDALKSLISEIQSIQSYAIGNGVHTRISFSNGGKEYTSSITGGRIISKNSFPEGMHIHTSSNLHSIDFHQNGGIRTLGSLTIVTSSGIVYLRFQFQHGRMIVDG